MAKRTKQIEDEIVERLSKGEPLRAICRDEHMPSWRSVYDWVDADEKFASRIAHAREVGYDAIAESCLEIADDATNDWMEKLDQDSVPVGYVLNGDHVQRSKLRIETRLKLLSKWSPKKYGEKTAIEHSGRIGLEELVAGGE